MATPHVITTAHINMHKKTAIYIGCSDARLAPDAPIALLKARNHSAAYSELAPGGCNILEAYRKVPMLNSEAAQLLEQISILLEAAQGTVTEIILTNHTDCARDFKEHNNRGELEQSLVSAERAATLAAAHFSTTPMLEYLHSHGYESLVVLSATFDLSQPGETGTWYQAPEPIRIFQ